MHLTSSLGAMYGNDGFRVPFDPETGRFDDAKPVREFIVGRGLMVRSSRANAPWLMNTRLAAVATLNNVSTFSCQVNEYLSVEDGRSKEERLADLIEGKVKFSEERSQFVTFYENAASDVKLPPDLFHGDMDAWWTAEEGFQHLSFVGETRKRLGIHIAQ